jgi:glutathione synthase/RimK-type ligase-like ATP-grasp enzyme
MAKVFIAPYKMGSESAKALSQEIGALRIRNERSKFKGNPNKVVINWGCSKLSDEAMKCRVINHPDAVSIAANKLKFFNKINEVGGVRVPETTTDKAVVQDWLRDGSSVVCRTILNGNSGAGIVLVEPGDDVEVVNAPLYVKYVPKKQEYRVHVRGGEVVDVQRKARRKETPDDQVNWKIRNHDNGFIFARQDIDCPDDVKAQALGAVEAIGLDFGAVDVIFNEKAQQAYVLEVNTAPGLSGTTLEGYAKAFGGLKDA